MITKERLEELIEQGADIWKIEDGKVYPLRKDHYEYWRIKEDRLEWYWKIVPSGFNYISFEHLFETKEDAEEYAEFGNITRTERLELPGWASIEKDFDKFTNGSYVLAERDEFSLELKISKPLISQIIIYTEDDDYNWNLSRENYNEARRLCVKLFKGEKQ